GLLAVAGLSSLYYVVELNRFPTEVYWALCLSYFAQSYLSLTLVFLALIPPILLPDQWGVVGWSVEGALIFMYALYRNSALS
ncbi:hypothetical protein VLF92_13430, partial [Pseudomonas chengduensis]